MSRPYDEIIRLPHPVSQKHPPMSVENRAAQFAPFAALTGYGDAIRETGRLTDRKIELDEYEKAVVNERLTAIQTRIKSHPEARITYFLPDERKSGGIYTVAEGAVKKIDGFMQAVILTDGARIPFDDIVSIDEI